MLPNYWGSLWFRRRASGERMGKPFYLCCSVTRSSFTIALDCLCSNGTADTAVFFSHTVKMHFISGYFAILVIFIKYILPYCIPAFWGESLSTEKRLCSELPLCTAKSCPPRTLQQWLSMMEQGSALPIALPKNIPISRKQHQINSHPSAAS